MSASGSGFWPTPTVAGMTRRPSHRMIEAVRTGVSYRANGTLPRMDLGLAIGGVPSPAWVEWLMGWPMGWTDSEPLEMARFRQWCHAHGARLEDEA